MSDKSYRAVWLSLLAAVAFGIALELVLGVFTGMGLDVRRVGERIGDRLKPGQKVEAKKDEPRKKMETGSVPVPAKPSQQALERARCEKDKRARITELEGQVIEAKAKLSECLRWAEHDLIRMWNPQWWCFSHKAHKGASEARLEVEQQFGC